jgi:hypothetical protein
MNFLHCHVESHRQEETTDTSGDEIDVMSDVEFDATTALRAICHGLERDHGVSGAWEQW